jgi:hypothetical protein
MKILDVGCGIKKHEGAVGIDLLELPHVDIVWNLDELPWPVEESAYDRVILSHVLEHLENPYAAMDEVHRVAAADAEVNIITPHFSSVSSWKDPTHKYHFAMETFDVFAEPRYGTEEPPRFELVERRINYRSGISSLFARLICGISQRVYERSAAFCFPARNIFVTYKVIK